MDSSESPFRFDNRENYAILTLYPLINDGQWANVSQVGTEILNRLATMPVPGPRLAIDLSPLDYMGSAQVALLVRVWKAIKKTEGGRMVVQCPGQMVREVLAIAGLKSLWEIVDTREAALAALGVADEARQRSNAVQPLLLGTGVLGVVGAAALIITGPHEGLLRAAQAGILALAFLSGLVAACRTPGWRRWAGAGIAVAGTALVGLTLSGWSPQQPPHRVAAADEDASRLHPPTTLISESTLRPPYEPSPPPAD